MPEETARVSSEDPAREPRQVGVDALEYSIIRPRSSRHPLALAAYEMWRDEWLATLRELDGLSRLHSDEFTRQDEIGLISLGGHCLSVTALRWIDLSVAADREDSYFRHWPEAVLGKLGAGLVAISTNTVIHSEWRRTSVEPARTAADAKPLPLAFVTIALAVRRAFDSSAGSVIGVARNDRGMNRVAQKLGGETIGLVELHGIGSDLMRFVRGQAKFQCSVVDALWERHLRDPELTGR